MSLLYSHPIAGLGVYNQTKDLKRGETRNPLNKQKVVIHEIIRKIGDIFEKEVC